MSNVIAVIVIIFFIVIIVGFVVQSVRRIKKHRIEKTAAGARGKLRLRFILIPIILMSVFMYTFLGGYWGTSPTLHNAYTASREFLERQTGSVGNKYSFSTRGKVIESENGSPKGHFIIDYKYFGTCGTLKLSFDNYDETEDFDIKQTKRPCPPE